MLKINGTDIPSPTDYTVSIMDLSNAERNANGTLIMERIATKRRIEVSYNYLSQAELSSLMSLVSTNVFFTVEYIDPMTGNDSTGIFYAGDRTSSAIDFRDGVMRYKDITFNMIER